MSKLMGSYWAGGPNDVMVYYELWLYAVKYVVTGYK